MPLVIIRVVPFVQSYSLPGCTVEDGLGDVRALLHASGFVQSIRKECPSSLVAEKDEVFAREWCLEQPVAPLAQVLATHVREPHSLVHSMCTALGRWEAVEKSVTVDGTYSPLQITKLTTTVIEEGNYLPESVVDRYVCSQYHTAARLSLEPYPSELSLTPTFTRHAFDPELHCAAMNLAPAFMELVRQGFFHFSFTQWSGGLPIDLEHGRHATVASLLGISYLTIPYLTVPRISETVAMQPSLLGISYLTISYRRY